MTLAQTITLTEEFLAYDLDGYLGSEPTTAEMVVAINWAIRTVAKRASLYDPSIPITLVAETSTYDLRSLATAGRRIIDTSTVIVNGSMLSNAARSAYGVWSLTELERMYPRWRVATSGTPSKAVVIGTKLVLHPPPNAACVAAGQNYVSGTYLPADMAEADVNVQLPLPIEVHEAVAYCAAVRLASPTVTEQAGMARIQNYSAEWVAAIDELARENEATLASWGSTTGSEGEETMWV